MTPLIPLTLAAVLFALDDDGIHDVRALVAAIEEAQKPIEDFRCEFGGSMYFFGSSAERERKPSADENGRPRLIAEDGLYDTFGGAFIWRRDGEMVMDVLHRQGGRRHDPARKQHRPPART